MLRSNEVILILLLVFLRRRIAYQISPVITEICWLLLAMRLLLPEAISVNGRSRQTSTLYYAPYLGTTSM